MPSPADPVGPIRTRVQIVLDEFLDEQRALLDSISGDLSPLLETAETLLGQGKRLRPAFCYWGWRAAGGNAAGATGKDHASPSRDAEQTLLVAASSLELFQAAALVHDDLIDDSDTRRGQPSAHRRLATYHQDEGWSGAGGRFGWAAAILLGDLLLGWSDELFFRSGLDEDALRRARPVFDRMRAEVGAGQYLDILAQVNTAVPAEVQVERARRVVLHKSARYSVQHPLVLGGQVAGAPERLLDRYAAYGVALGEAFQLRDDLLGVFGDPGQTGKPAGDDLREGKRTVLVAYARAKADTEQERTMEGLLGDPSLDATGVDRLRRILVDTGARDRVEERISGLVADAEQALAEADVTDDGRQALAALVRHATIRAS